MPVRWAGAASLVAGLVVLGIAFPALASAHTPSITNSTSCSTAGDGSWNVTFTVHNDPSSSYGVANISGTGTGLDGKQVATGGGTQSVTLHEPSSAASVSISGTLTWPKDGYHAPFSDSANKPNGCTPNTPNVTLCHGTNSNTNPYEQITVDAAGAYDGHLGHTGPVWNSTLKDQHISWGDVIPPFTYQGKDYSLNWDATGQAIWRVGCNIPSTTNTVTATVTEPGPTVTVTGPTTTITQTVPVTETQTATVTEPGPTTTIPGPTTTVIEPGPTVTLTETATATATQTDTATVTAPGPTQTVTVTQPGPTVTVTQTVAGEVSTVTETVTETPPTVTVTQEASTVTSTVTVTQSAAVLGTSTSAAPAAVKTVTVTKFNCPPGSAVQGGSLAYTGSGDPTMAMIGGALVAGGAVCLLMGRKRRAVRAH